MSTAIDYSALLKRAKAAKKTASAPKPSSTSSATTASSSATKGFEKKPSNDVSIVDMFKISPEGLDRAFYIPDFVTKEEEQFSLNQV